MYEAIHGQVLQALSGDQLILILSGKDPNAASSQRRLALSSVRSPRLGNAKRGVAEEPGAWAAKMRLAKLTVGKQATVSVDYEREIGEETVSFCTVTVGGKNVAEQLAGEGLVTVVRHRDDEARAAAYDALLAAESRAKAGKKGLFSPALSLHPRVDFSETPAKAKTNLHFLRSAGKCRGFIDYVFSPTHFILWVPAENCVFSLSLQGLQNLQDETATMATRVKLLQREVSLQVWAVDRGGSFLGDMWLDGGKESVAAMTLREGVTRVNETAIGFCAEAKQLLAAEAAAREAKRGLWGKLAAEEAAKVGLAGECEDSRGRRRWWGR